MKLYISNPENVEIPPENNVNIFIDSETSTLKGKMVDSSILEFSKTVEVEPDYSNLGITVSSSDIKAGKYFIDSTGTLQEGSLNESNVTTNNNEVIVSNGFIDETQTIQVGTLYSGSNELTPSIEDQTIVADTFLSNQVVIKGDSNLLAENIKEGVTIFGVVGTYAANGSGSSSTESDIVSLLNLPRAISDYTNEHIGEIISIPYTDASGTISGPIIFEVVAVNHHKDISNESKPTITLMSKNVFRYAAFDAQERNNPLYDENYFENCRADFGNNRWSVSNIRQWLNSSGAANEWFTPQHEYDAEPEINNVSYPDGYNDFGAYSDEAGFLAGFSADVLQHFATIRNKTVLCIADKSLLSKDFEETEDKVFLPSYTEMGYGDLDSNNPEGSHITKFNSNESRIKTGALGYYWMRSPRTDLTSFVTKVGNDGIKSNNNAYNGCIGIAPLLVLC